MVIVKGQQQYFTILTLSDGTEVAGTLRYDRTMGTINLFTNDASLLDCSLLEVLYWLHFEVILFIYNV